MGNHSLAVAETATPLTRPQAHAPVLDFSGGSLGDKWQMAEMLSKSQLVPRDFQGKPGDILIVADLGASLGMSVAQSIQTIACIKGRPVIWGDGMKGLVLRSPLCEWILETEIGTCENCKRPIIRDAEEGRKPEWRHQGTDSIPCADPKTIATLVVDDAYGYRCSAKRRGDPNVVVNEFTIGDAKRAKLYGKDGPWTEYGPRRMCRMRARSWTCRDGFADVLKGLAMREEIVDVPDAVAAAIVQAPTRTEALKIALAAQNAVATAVATDLAEPSAANAQTDAQHASVDEIPAATASAQLAAASLDDQITAALDAAAAGDKDFSKMKGAELRVYVNVEAEKLGLKPWHMSEIEKATPQGRLLRENMVSVLRAARERVLRAQLSSGDVTIAAEPTEASTQPLRGPLDFAMMSSEELTDTVNDAAFSKNVSEAALNVILRAFAPDGLTSDNIATVLAEIAKRAASA